MSEARSFLRMTAIVCVVGALLSLLGLVPDSTASVVLGVLDVALDGTMVALAWGLTVSRPSRWANIAAPAMLVVCVGPYVLTASGISLDWTVLAAVGAGANGVLALALLERLRHDRWAWVGVAAIVLATLGGTLGLVERAEVIVGARVVFLVGVALLCTRGMRLEVGVERPGSVQAWKDAEDGTRVAVLGERVRMWSVVGVVMLGIALSAGGLASVLVYLITLVNGIALALTTRGLWRMRHSPAGRTWLAVARGLTLACCIAVLFEVLFVFGPLIGLSLESSGAMQLVSRRVVTHCALPPLLAVALLGLGRRAGQDVTVEAASTIRWYVFGLLLQLGQLVAIRMGSRTALIVLGLAILVCLIGSVIALSTLSRMVRGAMPAAAANDVFGEAPSA